MSEFKRGDRVRVDQGLGRYEEAEYVAPGRGGTTWGLVFLTGEYAGSCVVTNMGITRILTDEEIAEQVAIERFLTDGAMREVKSAIRLAFRLRDERDKK